MRRIRATIVSSKKLWGNGRGAGGKSTSGSWIWVFSFNLQFFFFMMVMRSRRNCSVTDTREGGDIPGGWSWDTGLDHAGGWLDRAVVPRVAILCPEKQTRPPLRIKEEGSAFQRKAMWASWPGGCRGSDQWWEMMRTWDLVAGERRTHVRDVYGVRTVWVCGE